MIRFKPAKGQRELFNGNKICQPTAEAHVPEYERRFASIVEKERGNLRRTLGKISTNSLFSDQKEKADDVLERWDELKGRVLGEAVEDLHMPIDGVGKIALGRIHRAQDRFRKEAGLMFQKDPLHITPSLKKSGFNLRTYRQGRMTQREWDLLHAGMRGLMD